MTRKYSKDDCKKLIYDLVENLEANLKHQVLQNKCENGQWNSLLGKIMTSDKYAMYCFEIEPDLTCPEVKIDPHNSSQVSYSVKISLLNLRFCACSLKSQENAFDMVAELFIKKLRESYVEFERNESIHMEVEHSTENEKKDKECSKFSDIWNDKVLSLINDKYNELKGLINASVVACVFMNRNDETKLISFTSGNKCVNATYLSCDGEALIDSHAEILAIRALRYFFYYQLSVYHSHQNDSIFEYSKITDKYALKKGISFGLYISSAPCGDCRIFRELELIDAYPKSCVPGALRIKLESGHTGRAISGSIFEYKNPTWEEIKKGSCQLVTMCCSDKLLRMNLLGVQGALLSLLIEPVYLKTIVIGEQLSLEGIKRSLYGRVKELVLLSGTFRLVEPRFIFSSVPKNFNPNPSKECLNWSVVSNKTEITRNKTGKPSEGTFISRISKISMFDLFVSLISISKSDTWKNRKNMTYYDFKQQGKEYQRTKKILFEILKQKKLGPWKSNPPIMDQFFSKHYR